jgi:two-component system, sensor histidine kinase YesM
MRRYGGSFQKKILARVFFAVVVPAFLLLLVFYVAWNAYVRKRIVQDVASSTATIAERIESDLVAYDDLLGRLESDPAVVTSLREKGAEADLHTVFHDIYDITKDRRVSAVIRGVGADGSPIFSTFGQPDSDEEMDPQWGFFGAMNRATGKVAAYRRSLRFGGTLQTEYSLGISVAGADGKTVGFLMADLSFTGSPEPLSEKGNGVTSAFMLTDEFDRIVAAYDEVSRDAFGRFIISGSGGEKEIDGVRYAYARVDLPRHLLKAYGLTSMDFILSSFRFGLYTISVIVVLFSAVFALVLRRSVQNLTRPMHEILAVMREVSRGDFSARLEVTSGDELEEIAASLNSLIVEMESTVKRLMAGIEQAKTAEMKQLQAQFNPHFLYNTLDSVKWMMKMGEADRASRVLTNLARVLRYSIRDRPEESMASMEEDLAAMKIYLEIHKLCMGDRLEVDYDVQSGLSHCRVPRLLIQPIVENAVLHGIPPTGSGRIGISIRGRDGLIVVRISDNGEGFTREPDPKQSMGLGLVQRRARLCYGDRFSLRIEGGDGGGSVVTLSFPQDAGGGSCSG